MTIKNQSSLITEVTNEIYQNSNNGISGANLQSVLIDTIQSSMTQFINITDYLTNTDGSADQTTQIQAAIAAAETNKISLYVPEGVLARADTGFICGTGPLRMFGGGTFLVNATPGSSQGDGIRWEPATSGNTTVSSISNVVYSGSYVSRLTVGNTTGWNIGAIGFLYSSDTYSFNGVTTKAELFSVLYVDSVNNYIYLGMVLADTYTTNINIMRLSEYQLDVNDVTFSFNGDPYTPSAGNTNQAFCVTGAIQPRVRARFISLPSIGLRLVSCWQPDVDVIIRNLRDKNDDPQYLGYGVVSTCATRGGTFKINATQTRHAFTTNHYTRPPWPMWSNGLPRENKITGEVRDNEYICFHTHDGCFDMVFENCVAVNSNPSPESASGGQYGFADSGCNTTFRNCSVKGDINGIYSQSQYYDYGQDNITRIYNFDMQGSIIEGNLPLLIQAASGVISNGYKQEIHFYNSYLSTIILAWASTFPKVKFFGCTLDTWPSIRVNSGEAHFYNCYRYSTASHEPIILNTGGTVVINNWIQDGSVYHGAVVEASAGGGNGTCTLIYGNVLTQTGGLALVKVDAGMTLTKTALTVLTNSI